MWRFDLAAWSLCIATGYEGRQACIEKSHYTPEVKILDVAKGNVTVNFSLGKSKFPKLEVKGMYETNLPLPLRSMGTLHREKSRDALAARPLPYC